MIRRATPDDGPEVSRVFVAARDEMPYLPRIEDQHRPLLGGWFIERAQIWLAEDDGAVVGFSGIEDEELTHLYVDPAAQNRGVGSELLEHAKTVRPERLELWVFQANDGARRFYERHGFRLVEQTDGSGNMEKEPDARYEWTSAG
ncbi:MAG: GNAT family N-acetyltransferase [Actinobacteria bacterium]|nr:GNAT family N-acetyltransferase [Actinomycetota bacterium]